MRRNKLKVILTFLIISISTEALACISCEPEGPSLVKPPNELFFDVVGYDHEGLIVEVILEIDIEGKVVVLSIESVSDQRVPMKILHKSIEQALFNPARGKHCERLPVAEYAHTFTY